MFCTYCGHDLTHARNFCPECGTKIVAASDSKLKAPKVNTTQPLNSNSPFTSTTTNHRNLKKGLKLVVLIILIPVLLLSTIGGRFVFVARLVNWYNED
jgi:uncharacterized membrane protein YvbJ